MIPNTLMRTRLHSCMRSSLRGLAAASEHTQKSRYHKKAKSKVCFCFSFVGFSACAKHGQALLWAWDSGSPFETCAQAISPGTLPRRTVCHHHLSEARRTSELHRLGFYFFDFGPFCYWILSLASTTQASKSGLLIIVECFNGITTGTHICTVLERRMGKRAWLSPAAALRPHFSKACVHERV
jgi:hypothetical protein